MSCGLDDIYIYVYVSEGLLETKESPMSKIAARKDVPTPRVRVEGTLWLKGVTQIWLHLVFCRAEGTFVAQAKVSRKSGWRGVNPKFVVVLGALSSRSSRTFFHVLLAALGETTPG